MNNGSGGSRRSFVSALTAYVELTHPGPLVMVLLVTAGLSYAIDASASAATRLAILLTMFGAQIPIGVANELVDRDIDRLTKPGKPLASGLVSERGAMRLLISGFFLLIAASLFLSWGSFVLAAIGCALGIAYSLWFKRTMFAWAPYVAALPLLPIWVSVAHGAFRLELLTSYPIGLFAAGGVQLAQSVADVDADRGANIRSVTTWAGEQRTVWLCGAAVTVAAVTVGAIGWRDPAAVVATILVFFAVLGSVLVYRIRPRMVARWLFPATAGEVVVLAIAWVYAIGA